MGTLMKHVAWRVGKTLEREILNAVAERNKSAKD
jgi:hypothetical protein